MRIDQFPRTHSVASTDILLTNTEAGTKGIESKELIAALLHLMNTREITSYIDISELQEVTKIGADDIFMVRSGGENKHIKNRDVLYSLINTSMGTIVRRNFYRGENLGDHVTAEQWEAIRTGTYKDMFVGDYWSIGGNAWRIVDFNYWRNRGDRACTQDHVVIMPDYQLYTGQMNSNNSTDGGYVNSDMYNTNLERAKTMIYDIFGEEHVLNHRNIFTVDVEGGVPTATIWTDSKVELPNETMLYGHHAFVRTGIGYAPEPDQRSLDICQLAFLQLYGRWINPHRQSLWLRDVADDVQFASLSSDGNCDKYRANGTMGIRPVFGLVG